MNRSEIVYPVEFVVKLWYSDRHEEEVNHGVTFGNSYTEAMKNIEAYYGDELISIDMMTMLEESPVYVLEDCLTHNDNELRIDGTISKWS